MIFVDGFRQQLFYICGLPDGFKAVKIYGLHCLHGLLPAWIALSLVLNVTRFVGFILFAELQSGLWKTLLFFEAKYLYLAVVGLITGAIGLGVTTGKTAAMSLASARRLPGGLVIR